MKIFYTRIFLFSTELKSTASGYIFYGQIGHKTYCFSDYQLRCSNHLLLIRELNRISSVTWAYRSPLPVSRCLTSCNVTAFDTYCATQISLNYKISILRSMLIYFVTSNDKLLSPSKENDCSIQIKNVSWYIGIRSDQRYSKRVVCEIEWNFTTFGFVSLPPTGVFL